MLKFCFGNDSIRETGKNSKELLIPYYKKFLKNCRENDIIYIPLCLDFDPIKSGTILLEQIGLKEL
ncbi:hypothetical protein PMAC_002572 [Pneumocystis sp. 'macacae']|nr:hypothetical protein PMAC_002572 [Pneumocystis sp. 'macacae']